MAKDTPEADTGTAQSRLCFVIMPFSSSDSCTKEEWTWIFEKLLKPAVENAGLGYQCRRSAATRGNLIAAIMDSLREAYVVVADLTDQNSNVFYELGVRHTLKNRTILLAQHEEFIPFDLRPYAYHIYDWKTVKGKQRLATKLRELLIDVDESPDRADNPVSDFLKGQPSPQALPEASDTASKEARLGQALAGPNSRGVDPLALGQDIASTRDLLRLRGIVRLTRMFFAAEWPSLIEELIREPTDAGRILEDEIWQHCLAYVERFAPDVRPLEAFGLPLVEAEYAAGLVEMLRVVQDWISWSAKIWPGPSLRAITGAPGLLALRLLATWGAKAAEIMSADVLATLLAHPLETTEAAGQTATLSLVERRDLFWPEGLLGRADLAVQYLSEESWKNDDVVKMFVSRQDYLNGLSRFLFTAALMYEARHPDEYFPLYPGFKLIRGSSGAVSGFVSGLRRDPKLLGALAQMAGEDVATFRAKWPERRKRLNEAQLGGRHDLFSDWDRIQEDI